MDLQWAPQTPRPIQDSSLGVLYVIYAANVRPFWISHKDHLSLHNSKGKARQRQRQRKSKWKWKIIFNQHCNGNVIKREKEKKKIRNQNENGNVNAINKPFLSMATKSLPFLRWTRNWKNTYWRSWASFLRRNSSAYKIKKSFSCPCQVKRKKKKITHV